MRNISSQRFRSAVTLVVNSGYKMEEQQNRNLIVHIHCVQERQDLGSAGLTWCSGEYFLSQLDQFLS